MKNQIELLAPTEYWQDLEKRKEQLQSLLFDIEKESNKCAKNLQRSLPESTLENLSINVSKSNGVTQYYLHKKGTEKSSGKGRYLSVKQRNIVENLLQQNYYKKVAENTSKELLQINRLLHLKNKITDFGKIWKSEKQKLIHPITLSDSAYIQKWKQIPFTPKSFSPNEAEYFTPKGLRVRSKSEIIIASVLDKYNIPYRYEFPVLINQKYFHPDFYCLNVRTRKEYIWEHFGLMDNPEYSRNIMEKILLYNGAGYFIGKNLIVTFEQSDFPLKTTQLEQLINEYLI